MKRSIALLVILAAGRAYGQDFEAGRTGWQLERLSSNFVVLRTDVVSPAQGKRSARQGLLILTCEPSVRRIRFQLSEVPRSPSIRASSEGRAIVRAWFQGQRSPSLPIYPSTYFFDDGSFEFREATAFSDSTMRGVLNLLRRVPDRLEIIVFKGNETRAFRPGTAMQFTLHDLEGSLGNIYGFEGLCSHTSS